MKNPNLGRPLCMVSTFLRDCRTIVYTIIGRSLEFRNIPVSTEKLVDAKTNGPANPARSYKPLLRNRLAPTVASQKRLYNITSPAPKPSPPPRCPRHRWRGRRWSVGRMRADRVSPRRLQIG